MKRTAPIILLLTAAVMAAVCLLSSCGSAGGRKASDWKGTWYREGDSVFSRCYAEIKNVNSKGFDFSITVYNGNKAGELKDCHADFDAKSVSYPENEDGENDYGLDQQYFEKNAAYYYAEDPRCYIMFYFESPESEELNIVFCTTDDYLAVEWTAFEGFGENAQITGIFSRNESYINTSLNEMGVLSRKTDDALQKMMGDTVYMRLLCCFQIHNEERSDTTGTNTPYEYGGAVHMHDGIGGTVHYGSMVGQQYAACVIEYDDGSVSAALSLENGSLAYYSNNWVYEKDQPFPIIIWVENYTREQNGEIVTSG